MNSFWYNNRFSIPIDFAVIGAGIVGLSAALALRKKRPSANIVVIERGNFSSGASIRNAGFSCFGSPSEILDDIENEGEDSAIERVKLRWKGLNGLISELGEEAIGLEKNGAFELFSQADTELYRSCKEKFNYLNARLQPIFGKDVYHWQDERIQSFGFKNIEHAAFIDNEASVNTGKMMQALWDKVASKGVRILTGLEISNVLENDKGLELVSTKGQTLSCAQVIIATNAYTKRLIQDIDLNPGRGQILLTEPVNNLPFKGNFHLDQGYFYFRNLGDRVLFGGGRNLDKEAEKTTAEGLTDLVQNRLEDILRNWILPGSQVAIAQRWSGIMAFGSTKQPIIEKRTDRIVLAVRSGGMGVAVGHTIGHKAADLALL